MTIEVSPAGSPTWLTSLAGRGSRSFSPRSCRYDRLVSLAGLSTGDREIIEDVITD
jgi:hypothetical protein